LVNLIFLSFVLIGLTNVSIDFLCMLYFLLVLKVVLFSCTLGKNPLEVDPDFTEDKCIICQEGYYETSPPVNVFDKGLISFMKLSKEREMTELHAHLSNMKSNNGKITVHHSCRQKFTDTRKKSSSVIPRKKLRSSSCGSDETSGFDWKSYCFFCSEKPEKKTLLLCKKVGAMPPPRWRGPCRYPVKTVQTLPIRDNLIKKANERDDDWGSQVLGRLLTCNDLVAEEAMYHDSCNKMHPK